ncbi:MAG: LemA family protein [Planctomycetes bacterium]|nr:LemA family protein [Planctomycetota bacterium]
MKGCLAALVLSVVAIVVVVLVGVLSLFSIRRTNIRLYHEVEKTHADIEAQLQRRLDLVENVVATVKKHVQHEQAVLSEIARSRHANAEAVVEKAVAALKGTKFADDPEAFMKLMGGLSTQIGTYLSVVVENYPDITASESFRDLRAILEGSENRISIARQDYNHAVAEYNAHVDTWGFMPFYPYKEHRKPFEADPGAERAPKVVLD